MHDEEAEAFVATAALSEYDFSAFKPMRFEFEPKSAGREDRLGAGFIQNRNTVTINVSQQPGEDATALARRTAQELERARQARQRGAMYDAVPAF